MQALAERGCEMFLEIGPSPRLIGMGRRCLPEDGYAWLPSLRPGRDDWQTLLDSLAQLYVRGAKIDWAGFDRDYRRRKTELPDLSVPAAALLVGAAERRRARRPVAPQRSGRVLHPLLGRRLVAAVAASRSSSRRSPPIGRRCWAITRFRGWW